MGKVEPAVVSRSPHRRELMRIIVHKSFMIQLASMYCFYIPNLTDGHGPRDILCMPLFLDKMLRYDAGNPVNGNRPTVKLHHIKTAQVFSIYLVIDMIYHAG